MLIAVKALNHNAVVCVNAAGQERIAMGKGIGFRVKAEDPVDPTRIQRTFIPSMEDPVDRLAALLPHLARADVAVAALALEKVTVNYGASVTRKIATPFTEHVASALRRARQDMTVNRSLATDVDLLHPRDMSFARTVIGSISTRTGLHLGDDEAAPVALYLVNARQGGGNMSRTLARAEMVSACLDLVRTHSLHRGEERAEWQRFAAHVRFLLDHGAHGPDDAPRSPVETVETILRASYPRSYRVAKEVAELVAGHRGSPLAGEEVAYLTMQCTRLLPER
ncbi:CAT RNA binding domain-containing protein [Austwickia chelonae]|uniref:CAT RNA binding domain-containing protein n=1 Tax=Austwickia chelonae TaxID=100225 RepID=UPI000E242AC2|nr:CAT RNA binding domain-containing protein [Austwickia chelonae]